MNRTSVWTVALVALVVAAAGLAGGCGGKDEDASTDKGKKANPGKRPVIGLSVLTTNNPFFNEIGDAMKAEAAKHGWDVVVVDGNNDPAKQQAQVKDFITRECIAIVLTPCDSEAVGAAIIEANKAGIPVFTADIANEAEGAKVISHIATDNLGGGVLAAKAMVQGLKARGDASGEIAIIDHPLIESVKLRTKGFKAQLAKENEADDVDLKVVKQLPGKGEQAASESVMRDILVSNPNLKGVFAINDPTALGVVAALGDKVKNVIVIGFDGQLLGKQAIKAGQVYADPIQFPRKIGKMTVEAIALYLEGKPVDKEYLIPTALYFKADAEKDPALK